MIPMFIPVEQRAVTPSPGVLPVAPGAAEIALKPAAPQMELPKVTEELLIEEVSIDGMCGVY